MKFTRYEKFPHSPYVSRVWMVPSAPFGTYPVAADGVWDMIFVEGGPNSEVLLSGPTSRVTLVDDLGGKSGFGIVFAPGVYLPHLPAKLMTNKTTRIAVSPDHTFELGGCRWDFPTYESVEDFIEQLTDRGMLQKETAFAPTAPAMSTRTKQRRVAAATGLTPIRHQQIQRAQQAAALLRSGRSVADVVQELGYADQAHLIRQLKEVTGYTPGQMTRGV